MYGEAFLPDERDENIMKQKSMDTVIHSLDASRRVAWAKYYNLELEVERLRDLAFELIDIIAFHDRIPNNDPAIKRINEIKGQVIK